MFRKLLTIFLLFCVAHSVLVAQNTDEQNQLALLYFSRGEYEKAIPLYENLYAQSRSVIYYDYLVRSHTALNRHEQAIELTKQQSKLFPNTVYYSATLARLYEESNQTKLAENIYQKIVKKNAKTAGEYFESSKALSDNKKYDYALAVLNAGLKKFPDNELLHNAKMTLLLAQRDFENLTSNGIEMLLHNLISVEQLENYLLVVFNHTVAQETKNNCQSLIEQAASKNASSQELQELLISVYVQQNNFKRAFVFAKSLDMRYKEQGERLLELGTIALSNEQYEVADDCFSYIVAKGKATPLYGEAIVKHLEIAHKRLFLISTPNSEQVQLLEKQYEKALNELGVNAENIDIIRSLAQLQALYLNKTEGAINLLQTAEALPRLSSKNRALCALERADIYLFSGNVWGANMIYAKVALDHKNNDIGNSARLKQAQVAYYNSQFSYAQALLDVLKASTSKLIANDAFELSQLIADNTMMDEDSTYRALQLFAKADLSLYQNKATQALAYLDSIQHNFAYHSLTDDVLMRKAQCAQKLNDSTAMLAYLTEITQNFAYDIFADNAYAMLADYYHFVAKDTAKAQEYYKILIMDFPQSYQSIVARKRFRELE